ncbi:MAG TPA: diacylglycerol kinase family protein [Chthoniobacterales bacterium]|jgi:diacylglycerol kinase family enzyme|nr:diacylglycerol kinase family protein [Chthoniobacterales bacterium]
MKVALFHNPKAGNGTFKVSDFVRSIENAGHKVLYVSIKAKDWREAFCEHIDRVIVAGGDGSVSRISPWLAARSLPFSILPLGTANNCARSLGQTHTAETIITNLGSADQTKVDLDLITTPAGQRSFLESAGVGLLPRFMSIMQNLQKKNGSKFRSLAGERLAHAKKYLRSMAKDISTFGCEVLLDNENISGDFLLLEVANMGLIGPSLSLATTVDPGDGLLDVVWVRRESRKEWLRYLKHFRPDEETPAPFEHRQCRRITFRRADVPWHIDGKVFPEIVNPCCATIYPGALQLIG